MSKFSTWVLVVHYVSFVGAQHGVHLRPGMLCAGTAREEEALAPCLAVPGAPLVVRGQLVGLQSWGFGCGYVHDLPLVYTHIAYYQRWVFEKNTNYCVVKFGRGSVVIICQDRCVPMALCCLYQPTGWMTV